MSNKVVAGICPKHGFYTGENCAQCKSAPKETVYISIFKPMVYEDIDVQPMLIDSKRQLREECKKRNLVPVRLL